MLTWIGGEWERCRLDPFYFVDNYCQIYDSITRRWIHFELWDFQRQFLSLIHENQHVIGLKARQLGFTWLCLAYPLWNMIFHPEYHAFLFSMRETESIALLERLRGMLLRLPWWMQPYNVLVNHSTRLKFSNGSEVYAFKPDAGDSYTGNYALIDEADLIRHLDRLISRVNPVIEAGGKLPIIGRVDKSRHITTFKTLYKEARAGKNEYAHFFAPWFAHPNRDKKWHARIVANAVSLDSVHEQYPATEEEALQRGEVGRYWPNFSYQDNVTFQADYIDGIPVQWWVDPGYINPFCILLVQERECKGIPDSLCIFDEVYLTHMLADSVYEHALKRPYEPPSLFIYDTESPQAAHTMRAIRDKYQFDCRVVGADKRKKADLIKLVRWHIGPTANGARLLYVHPRCEHTIEQLADYHMVTSQSTAQRGGDPVPDPQQEDHAADAVQYGMTLRKSKYGDILED